MSLVNAFTYQRLLRIHYVALMAQVHSVTPLPIKNPLSHVPMRTTAIRVLLEKAITFE